MVTRLNIKPCWIPRKKLGLEATSIVVIVAAPTDAPTCCDIEIIVVPLGICSGERRERAVAEIGITTIPCANPRIKQVSSMYVTVVAVLNRKKPDVAQRERMSPTITIDFAPYLSVKRPDKGIVIIAPMPIGILRRPDRRLDHPRRC